jgi:hypothetical protein
MSYLLYQILKSARGKNKQVPKKIGTRVVREDLLEEVTLAWRPECCE